MGHTRHFEGDLCSKKYSTCTALQAVLGLQTRSIFNQVQVRVLRIIFFEFKFGKNDLVRRVRVQVRSPGLYRSQWHEQINDMQFFFW